MPHFISPLVVIWNLPSKLRKLLFQKVWFYFSFPVLSSLNFTSKKKKKKKINVAANLVLNVDGCIAALFLDLMERFGKKKKEKKRKKNEKKKRTIIFLSESDNLSDLFFSVALLSMRQKLKKLLKLGYLNGLFALARFLFLFFLHRPISLSLFLSL